MAVIVEVDSEVVLAERMSAIVRLGP